MKTLKCLSLLCLSASLFVTTPLWGQGAGFAPSLIGGTGVLKVQAPDTYYDGANGTLFAAVPLPTGASRLQFRVTGGVITDSSTQYGSADGLYADGRTPYNWTATSWNGTYQGVRIGSTTGIDPALFGVFFSPAFSGTPANSDNYRSDSGIIPDPRTLPFYTPSLNQPFYIGDGYTTTNAYVTNVDTFIPPGMIQTFVIPAGATHLLLGIGADINMADNQNASDTNSAFLAHVYDDSASPPVIASLAGPASPVCQGATASFVVELAYGAMPLTYQWQLNQTNLTDNARVSGSQSNILLVTGLQMSDSGVYSVIVSNLLGHASSNVQFTVYPAQTAAFTGLSIPANAEIHGAGNAGLPDPSGGVMPLLVSLPPNTASIIVSNVSGSISLNGGSGHNNADGVMTSGYGYPSSSFTYAFGGLSGLRIPGAGALVGVFEPPAAPAANAPASLDFVAVGTSFGILAPQLFQTFFVGDGLQGDGSGMGQVFLVPPGATRLFLGIPDAGGYGGQPGGYADNSGSFTASVLAIFPLTINLTPQIVGASLSFSFSTLNNQNYSVWGTTNLAGGTWTVCTKLTGDGLPFTFTAPLATAPAQFFRVSMP